MSRSLSAAFAALALLAATPAAASTFVSVFDFNWSGSVGTDGIWGITASSEFIDPFPDDDPRFDQVNVAYTVSGRVDIVGTPGTTFTRENVIALNLDVMTGGYRLASYSFAKDDLRVGIMSGEIVTTPLGEIEAELSAFRLMQKIDPTDPLQKFEQIFGCPTITDSCGGGVWSTPVPAYLSGNPTPPLGTSATYGVVVLTDGQSDPCCGARSNALRFFYPTVDDALASYRLTLNRDASYFIDDIPGGLPTPVPLPASMSLMLGGLGLLSLMRMRRRKAASS